MQQHKISVIVPVYNAEKYLSRCAESILSQTYQNIELILVNDGSNDGSLQLCRQIAKKDPRAKVLDKPNGGAASARNLGLDHATGDFIGFCDADDYLDSNMLEIMLKTLLENNLDTLECTSKVWDEAGKLLQTDADDGNIYIESSVDSIRRIYLRQGNVHLAVRLTNSAVLQDLRIPEGKRVEDFYFTILLLMRVKTNGRIHCPFYNYTLSDGSVTRSATGSIYLDALYFYDRSVEALNEWDVSFSVEQIYYRMKMYYLLAISMTGEERREHKLQIAKFKKDIRKNRSAWNSTILTEKEKMILQLAAFSFTACRFAYLMKNGR